jgi:hypothetical protein
MPKFTIEATYRLPVYRHRTYEADCLQDALRQAIEDEEWEGATEDYDTSGETYITGAWEGEKTAYHGPNLPIPPEFNETVQRKAAMFDEMLAALNRISEYPKQGEPCPDDPTYKQTWDDCGIDLPIETLHEVIDIARSAITRASAINVVT